MWKPCQRNAGCIYSRLDFWNLPNPKMSLVYSLFGSCFFWWVAWLSESRNCCLQVLLGIGTMTSSSIDECPQSPWGHGSSAADEAALAEWLLRIRWSSLLRPESESWQMRSFNEMLQTFFCVLLAFFATWWRGPCNVRLIILWWFSLGGHHVI